VADERGLEWPLRISQEQRDGVLVVTLAGRVGCVAAERLRQALNEAIVQGDRRLVVDFSLVDYVSSAGLEALEEAATLCADSHGTLVLCGVSAPVRLVLDVAGALSRFPIEPSRDHAVARAAVGNSGATPRPSCSRAYNEKLD